jgi:hypothetical protein
MRYRDPQQRLPDQLQPRLPARQLPGHPGPDLQVPGDGTQNRAIYREHQYSRGTDLSRAESAGI